MRSELGIHPLLGERYSPRAFADRGIPDEGLERLMEAARWAPSSRNEQPWRFLVTRRGGEGHPELLSTLDASNRRWAHKAPVLVLCLVQRLFSRLGVENLHARHDLGLAVAQLTTQATSMGLGLHQLGGFDPQGARAVFGIPEDYDLVSVLAIGFPGEADDLPEDLRDRETHHSARKPLTEIVWHGRYRG